MTSIRRNNRGRWNDPDITRVSRIVAYDFRTLAPSRRKRRMTRALLVLLILSAILRLWGIDFGLPNLNARPDETAITEAGVSVLRGTFRPTSFNYPMLF